MTYQSIISRGASCDHLSWPRIAPGFGTAEKHYMIPFHADKGLPSELFHWQPFVDVMLSGIHTEDVIYLMVDQDFVKAGTPHRRPGVHIDGYWHPNDMGAAFADAPGMHRPRHGYDPPPAHGPRHIARGWDPYPPTHSSRSNGDWNNPDFSKDEAIILMTNIQAARGYAGDWDGFIGDGGDCSKVDVSLLDPIDFETNRAYIGNVSMLHQSLPVPVDCERTVIRLNCPGVSVS